ncbi:hypothetical protein QR680_000345 [Steinernema hermaphroditum]|uniref:Uncharacterized protein n=1 Tax=Steinernema hermaphroditum TaxID=289476 RepID=A0AA39GU87_9BILA|nr:hypothetical protein QR680_000345 [Steinernema hermaphroditum]
MQRITIEGFLSCGTMTNVEGAHIQIWEEDVLFDDKIGRPVHSNPNRYFLVEGRQNEWGSIDPLLVITHRCMMGTQKKNLCRESTFTISRHHINGVVYERKNPTSSHSRRPTYDSRPPRVVHRQSTRQEVQRPGR